MDYYIDEDDIDGREHQNEIMLFYILSLMLMEAIYVALHAVASFFSAEFQLTNPICLLLAVDFGFFITKRLFGPRFILNYREDFLLLVVYMMSIAAVFQVTVKSEETSDFVLYILHTALASLVITCLLFLLLTANLM